MWAIAATDGTIMVRDFNKRRALAVLPARSGRGAIALGPLGRRLVTLWQERLQWWDLATARSIAQIGSYRRHTRANHRSGGRAVPDRVG